MKHLTAEQLSARLDGELKGRALEEVERHLVECEACRTALASLTAQDHSLQSILAHDPGEPYFESFTARVEDRIRAEGLAGAQSRSGEPGRFSWTEWTRSPGALAAVGGVAALVVVAGLAVLLLRERPESSLRRPALEGRAGQQARPEPPPAATPSQPPAPAAGDEEIVTPGPTVGGTTEKDQAAPSTRARATDEIAPSAGMRDKREFAPAPAAEAPARGAQPGRMVELKTLPNGEQVPVERGTFKFAEPQAKPQQAPPASGPTRVLKQQYVQPMGQAPSQKPTPESQAQAGGKLQRGGASPAPREEVQQTSPPAPVATQQASPSAPDVSRQAGPPAPGASQEISKSGAPTGNQQQESLNAASRAAAAAPLCGKVTDPSGRPVAGAQVAVAELGLTATSGPDGGFCIQVPAGSWTVTAMAVGYRVQRQNVKMDGQRSDLNVALEPVNVLEDKRAFAGAGRSAPPAPTRSETPALSWYAEPTPDEFPSLTDSQRVLVRRAQKLSADAARANSALLHDAAAWTWQRELARLSGGPSEVDARFRLAEARFNAWRLGPSAKRSAAATEALTAYLVRAPQGPHRALAVRWLDQVKR